ncbi:MAG: Gfo/Idh/MocA family oxidoreductase [Acidobacteriota bacterium]|nr:Gfo/Idh/MocA family oxidoreductase [Acidobacteriota bacterium]
MIRRDFMKSAVTLGAVSASGLSLGAAPAALPKKKGKAKYRGGVVGLGWMGVLYDMGTRDYENIGGSYKTPKYDLESAKRPTPDWLDVHRKFHHHDHPGKEGLVATYAEAIWDRPEVELVAGADRDKKRLSMFGERYGITALYTDALEMYEKENLDILAIATNTRGRSFLTVKAVEAGVKGIFVDKPMTFTLKEADDMVNACAKAGVPLVGGATTTSHPSFAKAKELVTGGAIGDVTSIEARVPLLSQHQCWVYFVDSELAWVSGIGDKPRRDRGSSEFMGQGIIVAKDGTVVHIRDGAPQVKISGSTGEIVFDGKRWILRQDVDTPSGRKGRVEIPWPDPQFGGMRTPWCLDDLIATMEGRMKEPKNSGRIVAMALEAELAMKQSSARGGERVELPLRDRSLGLTYDWFR